MTTTTTSTNTESVLEAMRRLGDAGAADLAVAAGIGRSTAGKCLVSLEAEGLARRVPGGREGGRRVADRWAPADRAAPKKLQQAGASAQDGTRLGKGELATLVLDHLGAHRGEALGPSAVGKALGRSSGAVANALGRLVESGQAKLVSDSPRRYQVAGR